MPEIEHLLTGFHVNVDQGSLALCTVVLIRGQRNILVDTGHKGRVSLLMESLASAGVQPDDIDALLLTHSHWDHTQNVDLFPKAKVLMHPKELEYAASPKPTDLATARYFHAMLQGHDIEEVSEGGEIEPGVSVLDTPGHTRGHVSVLVETSQGRVCISGDALPMASSVVSKQIMAIFWDEKEAVDSIEKLLDASRVFYPGHDRAFRLHARNAVEYISGADSIRVTLGHDGAGDMTLKVAPDAPTVARIME